jgi:hypothetical protein
MPKGYVIFTEDIRDEAGISAYARQAKSNAVIVAGFEPPAR